MARNPTNKTDGVSLRQLAPLLFLCLFVAILGCVGYQIYLTVVKIRDQAAKHMGDRNISFSKTGISVGVRHMSNERYVDATQRVVVGVWNQRMAAIAKPEQRKRFWSRSRKSSM